MPETTDFERHVAAEMLHRAGPVRPVDDLAVFDTVVAATRSSTWRPWSTSKPSVSGPYGRITGRTQVMFGPPRAIIAALLVVALGSVFLNAQLFGRQGGGVPGAATDVEATATPGDAGSPSAVMTGAWAGSTATVLPGGRVLITGWGAEGVSADLYDPITRVYTPDTAFPTGFSPAAALLDGRLLLIAEEGAAGLYDPSDGSYTRTAHAPVTAEGVVVRLQDGRVLLAGRDAAYLFDPATGAFAETGAPPSAGLGAGGAMLLRDGRVLVPSGLGRNDVPVIAHLYDPATGMFTPTATMSEPRYAYTATVLPDDRVLIAGGNDAAFWTRAYDSAELYDPGTGVFTPTGTMADARFDHTATILPDGRVLIVGGTSDGTESLASAELYDPGTGTFTSTGPLTEARRGAVLVPLQNGLVLVAGGRVLGERPLASAELYDPVTGTFTMNQPVATATPAP
jgi:large repetitive protein